MKLPLQGERGKLHRFDCVRTSMPSIRLTPVEPHSQKFTVIGRNINRGLCPTDESSSERGGGGGGSS